MSRQILRDVIHDQRVTTQLIGQQSCCLDSIEQTLNCFLGFENSLYVAHCHCEASAHVDHIVCKHIAFLIIQLCYHIPIYNSMEVIDLLNGCWEVVRYVVHYENIALVMQKGVITSEHASRLTVYPQGDGASLCFGWSRPCCAGVWHTRCNSSHRVIRQ